VKQHESMSQRASNSHICLHGARSFVADYIQLTPKYINRYDRGVIANCRAFWCWEDLGEEGIASAPSKPADKGAHIV